MSARLKRSPRLRSSRRPLVALNLTPLIDVLLILIVILMLAMPMFVKQMAVELPKTSLNGVPAIAHSLLLEIDQHGAVWAQGETVSWEHLASRIDEGVTVQIAADYRIAYGKLTELVQHVQAQTPRDIVLLVR